MQVQVLACSTPRPGRRLCSLRGRRAPTPPLSLLDRFILFSQTPSPAPRPQAPITEVCQTDRVQLLAWLARPQLHPADLHDTESESLSRGHPGRVADPCSPPPATPFVPQPWRPPSRNSTSWSSPSTRLAVNRYAICPHSASACQLLGLSPHSFVHLALHTVC